MAGNTLAQRKNKALQRRNKGFAKTRAFLNRLVIAHENEKKRIAHRERPNPMARKEAKSAALKKKTT